MADDRREPAARLVHRGLGRAEIFDLAEDDLPGLSDRLAALAAEGRPAFSVHAPLVRPRWFAHGGVTCFFLHEDATWRHQSLVLLDDTLAHARRFGADYVVTHLTFGPTDTTDPGVAAVLAHQAAQDMAELSRRYAMPIDVEFAAYSDGFHQARDFAALVSAFPELGVCLDVGHTFIGARQRGRSAVADIATLAPVARSMHLWNWRPGETGHVALHPSQREEDGWIPIPTVITAAIGRNPDLRIIFEYPVEAVTPDIRLGYDWAESLVRAAGGVTRPGHP